MVKLQDRGGIGVLQPGDAVEILEPSLYMGLRGQLLQIETVQHGVLSGRWLVVVETGSEALILSLAPGEFRRCQEP